MKSEDELDYELKMRNFETQVKQQMAWESFSKSQHYDSELAKKTINKKSSSQTKPKSTNDRPDADESNEETNTRSEAKKASN